MQSSVHWSKTEDWQALVGLYDAGVRQRRMIRVVNVDAHGGNSYRINNMDVGSIRFGDNCQWLVYPMPRVRVVNSVPTGRILAMTFEAAVLLSAMLHQCKDMDKVLLMEMAGELKWFADNGYREAQHARRVLLSIVHDITMPIKVSDPGRHKLDLYPFRSTVRDVLDGTIYPVTSSAFEVFERDIASLADNEYRIAYEFWDSTFTTVRGRMIAVATETDAILLSSSLDTLYDREDS